VERFGKFSILKGKTEKANKNRWLFATAGNQAILTPPSLENDERPGRLNNVENVPNLPKHYLLKGIFSQPKLQTLRSHQSIY